MEKLLRNIVAVRSKLSTPRQIWIFINRIIILVKFRSIVNPINHCTVQVLQMSSSSCDDMTLVCSLLHSVLAWQLQKIEHDIWAMIQLHLPVEHGRAEAHPHLIIFSTSTGTGETSSGSITGTNLSSFITHPYLTGSAAAGGVPESDAFQIMVWWWAR